MASTDKIGIIDPISYNIFLSLTYRCSADFIDLDTNLDMLCFSNYSKMGFLNFIIKFTGLKLEFTTKTKIFTLGGNNLPKIADQDVPMKNIYRTVISGYNTDYTSDTKVHLQSGTNGSKNTIDIYSCTDFPFNINKSTASSLVICEISTPIVLQ